MKYTPYNVRIAGGFRKKEPRIVKTSIHDDTNTQYTCTCNYAQNLLIQHYLSVVATIFDTICSNEGDNAYVSTSSAELVVKADS